MGTWACVCRNYDVRSGRMRGLQHIHCLYTTVMSVPEVARGDSDWSPVVRAPDRISIPHRALLRKVWGALLWFK